MSFEVERRIQKPGYNSNVIPTTQYCIVIDVTRLRNSDCVNCENGERIRETELVFGSRSCVEQVESVSYDED